MLTAAEMVTLERTVGLNVKKWQGHPDYDDLRQEARIAAWTAVEEVRARGQTFALTTIVARAAAWKALDFLRTPQASRRVLRPGQEPGIIFVPLDSLRDEDSDEERAADQQPQTPRSEDFVPALLDALSNQAVVDDLLRFCWPTQASTVMACYLEEQTITEYAAQEGVGANAIHERLKRVFSRYRAAVEEETE